MSKTFTPLSIPAFPFLMLSTLSLYLPQKLPFPFTKPIHYLSLSLLSKATNRPIHGSRLENRPVGSDASDQTRQQCLLTLHLQVIYPLYCWVLLWCSLDSGYLPPNTASRALPKKNQFGRKDT